MPTTLVYRYGLRPPIQNAQFITDQMEIAHRYRNALVENTQTERKARRATIEALPEVQAAMDEARAKIDAVVRARKDLKKEHIDARKKKHSENTETTLEFARAACKEAMKKLEAVRKRAARNPVVSAEIKRILDVSHKGLLSARHTKSPWWGTYKFVEASHEQSLRLVLAPGKSKELPLWDGLDARDPRFVPRAAAKFMIGAYNNRGEKKAPREWLTIEPGIVLGNAKNSPSQKRQDTYRVLCMQVGVERKGGDAVYGRWPMVMHRPIPAGAKITECKVLLKTEGPNKRWEAHLTLNMDACERREECGEGRVAVDIGWRMIDDEIRVARVVADDGTQYELRLDSRLVESIEKPASLRSIRDINHDKIRTELLSWCAKNKTPTWLDTALENAPLWKSQKHLVRVTGTWSHERFHGDEEMFAKIEAWRLQDLHLWDWECSLRSQSLAQREQRYREFARKLSGLYRELVIEDFDLREVAKKSPGESEEHENEKARANRVKASTSELRGILIHAFLVRGGVVRKRDPSLTTHECPMCAAITDFDAARHISWTCESCGARWDQDDSACRILLSRDTRELERERSVTPEGASATSESTAKPESKRESRWTRLRREKKERDEKRKEDEKRELEALAEAAREAEGKKNE
jgi:hypothetical protein